MNSRANLASCHAELGTFAEGRVLGEGGLQIAETEAHPESLMFASWGMGLLSLRQGDLLRALPWLERALHICQEGDLLLYFPKVAIRLGAAYTLLQGVPPTPCRCSRRRWSSTWRWEEDAMRRSVVSP